MYNEPINQIRIQSKKIDMTLKYANHYMNMGLEIHTSLNQEHQLANVPPFSENCQ